MTVDELLDVMIDDLDVIVELFADVDDAFDVVVEVFVVERAFGAGAPLTLTSWKSKQKPNTAIEVKIFMIVKDACDGRISSGETFFCSMDEAHI